MNTELSASAYKPRRSTTTDKRTVGLKTLIGSGDKIALLMLPFLVVGVALNVAFPSLFAVGGPPGPLRVVAVTLLVPGVAIWAWSAVLLLRHVPRGRLVTTGPYALVKHPLYTSVALLVLPWAGVLLNTWLGAVLGAVLYTASRRYAPAEETELSNTFGAAWAAYRNKVKLPWL